jgi:hypothetical protein
MRCGVTLPLMSRPPMRALMSMNWSNVILPSLSA